MYCKDCKWFTGGGKILKSYKDKIILDIKFGRCDNMTKLANNIDMESDDQLTYDNDFENNLLVGELFGCVHFKEKE